MRKEVKKYIDIISVSLLFPVRRWITIPVSWPDCGEKAPSLSVTILPLCIVSSGNFGTRQVADPLQVTSTSSRRTAGNRLGLTKNHVCTLYVWWNHDSHLTTEPRLTLSFIIDNGEKQTLSWLRLPWFIPSSSPWSKACRRRGWPISTSTPE